MHHPNSRQMSAFQVWTSSGQKNQPEASPVLKSERPWVLVWLASPAPVRACVNPPDDEQSILIRYPDG